MLALCTRLSCSPVASNLRTPRRAPSLAAARRFRFARALLEFLESRVLLSAGLGVDAAVSRSTHNGASWSRANTERQPALIAAIASRYHLDSAFLSDQLHHDSTLHADPGGGLYYADVAPAAPDSLVLSAAAPFPYGSTFSLHSRPGAANVIYLDFDGYVTPAGTAWNSGNSITSGAFDTDGNPGSFSQSEQDTIQSVWQRVAEDYAPFDVDVTTEFPGDAGLTRSDSGDSHYGIRVVISPDNEWYGNYGGVAYIGVFSYVGDYYKPCFVFSDQLANYDKYIAEAASHEVGHTLGLLHDGTTAGVEYYAGHGSDPTGWSTIMGVGYYQNVVQWSCGEYYNANNTQDDLAIITTQNGFTYRPDDYGSTRAAATPLSVASDGTYSLQGVIEQSTDADFFSFSTSGGNASFHITPFTLAPDLDIKATLLDSNGTILSVADSPSVLDATINAVTLYAGTYFLEVQGTGWGSPLSNPPTGYTAYGSLGQYSITGSVVGARTIYVDQHAPTGGTHDGASWNLAYRDLQTALAAAGAGDQILVADGTYNPTAGTDRSISFQLKSSVSILGGYAGYGAADPNARDPAFYPTLLSGDIGNPGDNSDNTYNVVMAYGVDSAAILDGFTVTGGSATGGGQTSGGGIYLYFNSYPTIRNCVFSANTASYYGGGMCNDNSSPTVVNCTFTGNSALVGGGMYNETSSPTVTNCIFTGNSAVASGGGMENVSSSPTVNNCAFSGNSAYRGGGLGDFSSSAPSLISCTFSANDADYFGGGIYNLNSNPILSTCTFSANSAYQDGGAIYNAYSSPALTNCSFSSNQSAKNGAGIYNGSASAPTLLNCNFDSNSCGPGSGGAMYNASSSATLTGCTFRGNGARAGDGGAISLFSSSALVVTNCTFSGNWTDEAGAILCSASSLTVVDSAFAQNIAQAAGAISIKNSPSANFVNCTFAGNRATDGAGALYITNSSSASFVNCTFAGNSAGYYSYGGALESFNSSVNLTNCILWGDTAYSLPEIYQSGGTVAVTYSDIQGGFTGTGNINADPQFIRNPSGSDSGDLRLQLSSPCIDAANNAAPGLPATDLAGNPRFINITGVPDTGAGTAPIVDLGAYEVQPYLYVDVNAAGTHTGQSWSEAMTSLNAALAAAIAGITIRVADGTYTPTFTSDRTVSFVLKTGVQLQGGYAGYGAPNPNARDTALYPSILSGDIGIPGSMGDNSYHVLTATSVDASATLDGFSITAGGANGASPDDCGGGMYLTNSNPTLINCIFGGNGADNFGGGIYSSYSNPSFSNCAFTGNRAENGGGAGIYNSHSNPILTNCTFSNNLTYSNGGAIYNAYSNPSLTQCTFSGPNTARYGGGIYNASASSPTLLNCTFEGNLLNLCEGAGMYNLGSSATLVGCTFHGNSASAGGGGAIELQASSNLTATDCTFLNNGADGAGGIECHSSSFSLFGCLFSNNGSSYSGGALYIQNSSSINVVNCLFSNNSATYTGGAMEILNSTSISFTNCTFVGNSVHYHDYGTGGVVGSFSSSIYFTNCILWGNTAPISPEIYQSGGTVAVTYSDVQGGFTGTGNINVDPKFIRSPSSSDSGDLRLCNTSPCIDAGNNAASSLSSVTTDLAAAPRFQDLPSISNTGAGTAPIVDMGAYESAPLYAYYRSSTFDGGSVVAALAPAILPLLPGQTASCANYTSYSRGINGIVIELRGSHSHFSASDFTFKTGNNNDPTSWTSAPAPLSITTRSISGNATRIIITWSDNAVQNTWLQTTLKGGTGSTSGLPADLVFYFGSAPGDTGNDPTSARVDMLDELTIRANHTTSAAITNPYDLNRDGAVNDTDDTFARTHTTCFLNELHLLTPPPVGSPLALAPSAPDTNTTPAATPAPAIEASHRAAAAMPAIENQKPKIENITPATAATIIPFPALITARLFSVSPCPPVSLSRSAITVPMTIYPLPMTKAHRPLASRRPAFISLKDPNDRFLSL